MTELDMSIVPAIYRLDERNRAAELVIRETALSHATVDAITGALGAAIPIPGAGLVTMGLQLAHQLASVFPGMIERLGAIYGAEPDAFVRQVVLTHTAIETTVDGLVTAAGADLMGEGAIAFLQTQFAADFLADIAPDLLKEAGGGAILSAIPILGIFASAGVDAALAATMTWRVGAVVSTYFQHGGYVKSRKDTLALVKRLGIGFSPEVDRSGSLTRIRKEAGAVRSKHEQFTRQQFKSLIDALSKSQICDLLKKQGIPDDIVDKISFEF